MKFYSTNKRSSPVDFKTALLRGLAGDGGLFMPAEFPAADNFEKAIGNFSEIPKLELKNILSDAFDFPAPIKKLDEKISILEIFHGPTLSFKDFGARFMARAMNYYLKESSKNLNIIVATSGDTGSAVASGFYGLSNIKVFVLYPSGRVSDIQEKQIATFGGNVTALEVKGDFDDCQKLAKTALADESLREKINLSSANSINIGRLLPQMSYYFNQQPVASSQLPIFVVPSGNFGNLTAGLFAKKCGLSVEKFIAAVNINSSIPEYLLTGKTKIKRTKLTASNAMDVGNPSNWARIEDLYGNNREAILEDVEAIPVTDDETRQTIREIYEKYNYVLDPHAAVGVAAALKSPLVESKIVLATAHPAKFKEIVEGAIGKKIPLPPQLVEVCRKTKQGIVIGKNYKQLQELLITSQ